MNIFGRTIALDRNKGIMAKDKESPGKRAWTKIGWLIKTLHRAMEAEK